MSCLGLNSYKKVWGQRVYLPLCNFVLYLKHTCDPFKHMSVSQTSPLLQDALNSEYPQSKHAGCDSPNLSILPTSSCQHWAEGYICTLNYLDCHLCIFNAAVSFFPFMARWNTTVSPLHLPLCVEVRFRINEFSLKPSSGQQFPQRWKPHIA